jgi:molybdopterin-guanine dinucleotide biosynthesis protein B
MAHLPYKLDRCKHLPKLVAVVGGKHSGKTTVIEHLTSELKRRGYHVGAIKEMVRIPTLDTPATETDRYTTVGAEIIAAIPRNETVIFIKKRLSLKEVLPFFKDLDYVILEGFESEKTLPKIIAAKTAEEAKEYLGDLTVAISGLIMESEEEIRKAAGFKVPMLKSPAQAGGIADLVERKAIMA